LQSQTLKTPSALCRRESPGARDPACGLVLGPARRRQWFALLGARVAEGLDVICVPTSERTRTQAALYSFRSPRSSFPDLI